IDAFDKAFGKDFGLSEQEGFLESGAFVQNMIGPTMLAHNWGDSGLKASVTPALFWYAQKLNDPSLLWFQNKIIADERAKFTGERILPALLLWAKSIGIDDVPPPSQKVW